MGESGPSRSVDAPTVHGSDPALTLAALRERGAHRFDPVRFRFIEALARRAAARDDAVRRALEGRLATLLADYVERQERAQSEVDPSGDLPMNRQDASDRGPLAELVQQIARQASARGPGGLAGEVAIDGDSPTELKALRYFRSTWSKLSVDRQMTQSQAKVPKNAGPLNSQLLVLRSLQLMREVSPAYLNRFMSYVDALLWLDAVGGGPAPAPAGAAHGESDKRRKAARSRPG